MKLLEIRTLKVEMTPDPLIELVTEKVQNTELCAQSNMGSFRVRGNSCKKHRVFLHSPTIDIQREYSELLKG